MKIAMVGLGKMGANMTQRLIEHGHQVVAFDLSDEARNAAATTGAEPAATLEEMASKLAPPRVAWVMVPAGEAHQRHHRPPWPACSNRATWSSTAATPTTKRPLPWSSQLAHKGIGPGRRRARRAASGG